MEIRIEEQVRGTRLLINETAKRRRVVLNTLIELAEANSFDEIVLPAIEPTKLYTDKAGPEILGQMYIFPDKADRSLCLRPEGTATCQRLTDGIYKYTKDVRLWYETRCWRYERPQAGRYREFTQFGVEILNPGNDYTKYLMELASKMISRFTSNFEVLSSVKRGLAYYEGDGFEIICPELGAQKQVCGGGAYKEGIGFAIGVDRLMLVRGED
jgi:histidyl-tRNA synthetase